MDIRRIPMWWIVTAAVILCTSPVPNPATALQPSPPDVEQGVRVLTRGPVHEAFAETVTFDPEPGISVARSLPDPIEELPPDQRPDGENITWIPGYWAWDDERDDFLWVSGVWRALPPGRQWVPGYWGRSGQISRWTSGYWADAEVSEIEYLPEPPGTVEVGPNIAPPSADYDWTPGSWVWHQGRYVWRPGCWVAVQPDWDWVPAHYVCAPYGYVFVDGYWDYSVARRGVLFAPVYFEPVVYARPDFSYSPSTVISLTVLSDHLFVRPQYHHYYFGDYYDAGYHDSGFYPSFSYHSSRFGYDPIYAHRRWEHRHDVEWEHQVVADFKQRREHVDYRPPRTLALQVDINMRKADAGPKRLVVARSLDQEVRRQEGSIRFKPVEQEERQRLGQRGREVRRFREERQRVENETADLPVAEKPSRESRPVRVRLGKSPIASKPVDQLGKDRTPPKRPQAPAPDPKVMPKPRKARAKPDVPRAERRDASKRELRENSKGESKKKPEDD